MFDAKQETQVEGFMLKWTMISVYTGVVLIFVTKTIGLLQRYILSGKMSKDIVVYIWNTIKAALTLG